MNKLFLDTMRRMVLLCTKSIEKLESRVRKMPEGTLAVSKTATRLLYYCINGNERTYLGKDKQKLRILLAQKEYCLACISDFAKIRDIMLGVLQKLENISKHGALSKMKEQKKKLVPSLKVFDAADDIWRTTNTKHVDKNTHPYETDKGDWVRSKAEVIIANMLFSLGVPYIYEYSLNIRGYHYEPDFYILNCITGNIVIWEHLGLMSDVNYVNRNADKIMNYLSAGFIYGKSLIFTMESDVCKMRTDVIRKMINDYCLGAVVKI